MRRSQDLMQELIASISHGLVAKTYRFLVGNCACAHSTRRVILIFFGKDSRRKQLNRADIVPKSSVLTFFSRPNLRAPWALGRMQPNFTGLFAHRLALVDLFGVSHEEGRWLLGKCYPSILFDGWSIYRGMGVRMGVTRYKWSPLRIMQGMCSIATQVTLQLGYVYI